MENRIQCFRLKSEGEGGSRVEGKSQRHLERMGRLVEEMRNQTGISRDWVDAGKPSAS